ncbi:uncharacterized protein LOC123524946 [Mercenaria mercenaria]|uniref:uncharacterized protein LOC123524946 n=1 Tax=Mercenaria mercenaria TaxID=6596 RepID=UPI00234F46CD|nr:uncharacterized protein LOC123524946 [Mercenaria mercenaria]
MKQSTIAESSYLTSFLEDASLKMKLKRSMQKLMIHCKLRMFRKQLFFPVSLCLVVALALLFFSRNSFNRINTDTFHHQDFKSTFRYHDFKATFHHHDFKANDMSLLVLVVGQRNAFDRRETIRNTWASAHKHVYFVVSELYCPFPPENRISGTCKPNNISATKERVHNYVQNEEEVTKKIRNESNVVLLPIVDVAKELPNVIKESYKWALQNHNTKWILHVEDLFNVYVDSFNVASNFDQKENTVFMLLRQCISSVDTGKHTNRSRHLTPFQCALNHFVPRQVAEYLVNGLNEIFEYTFKDKQNYSTVQVLDSKHMKSAHREDIAFMTVNAEVYNSAAIVLDLCIKHEMNNCVDNTTYTLSENPSNFLNAGRFDLIVKMVYAYFYVFEKRVPDIIKVAYLKHLQIMNSFEESCEMKDVWFNSKVTSKEQKSSSDSISSFHKTIESVRKFGFNPNISRIPVDKNGFISNGAHRLASTVVLSRKASFEQHTYKHISGFGYRYFQSLGMSQNVFDLVMLEWMRIQLKLPDLNTPIFIISVFSNDDSKDEKMRTIVKERCSKDNGIAYEKSVIITREGARQVISHMYGQQSWLEAKIQHMLSRFTHSTFTVLFIFIYTKRSTDLVKCKLEIRKLYNDKIFKSTAHIPDTTEENLILAEMILNPNSIQFLNYANNAPDCKLIAKEIATRLSFAAIKTLPGIYLGRNDIMVDSGTVLGYFDLRRRTDVDILFLNDIDKSILGNHHGMNIQAHAFKFNSISKERAWGEDHFSASGTRNQWDLFYDPQNYGYCYGIKFVSLKQLVRYKVQRNEPNKDSHDVGLINRLLETIKKK